MLKPRPHVILTQLPEAYHLCGSFSMAATRSRRWLISGASGWERIFGFIEKGGGSFERSFGIYQRQLVPCIKKIDPSRLRFTTRMSNMPPAMGRPRSMKVCSTVMVSAQYPRTTASQQLTTIAEP